MYILCLPNVPFMVKPFVPNCKLLSRVRILLAPDIITPLDPDNWVIVEPGPAPAPGAFNDMFGVVREKSAPEYDPGPIYNTLPCNVPSSVKAVDISLTPSLA